MYLREGLTYLRLTAVQEFGDLPDEVIMGLRVPSGGDRTID